MTETEFYMAVVKLREVQHRLREIGLTADEKESKKIGHKIDEEILRRKKENEPKQQGLWQ